MKYIIAAYGLEGRAAQKYFQSLPYTTDVLIIPDDHERSFRSQLPPDYQNWVIIRTPAAHPEKFPPDAKVWSITNEFFAKCPCPIIGITGTKGKGTTASFISEIIRAAGRVAHLIGNIGVPSIEILSQIKPDDIAVYELSSFQLWDIQKSPHIAVITIIEPEHLDVHKDYNEYRSAKANIVKFQTEDDFIVYNKDDREVTKIAESSKGQKIPYPTDNYSEIINKNIQLVGDHNKQDANAAILAVKAALPNTTDEQIATGLKNFKGLPHHIEFVAEINGVEYYDDSFASNPSATKVALKSFQAPIILIAGGLDRGLDLNNFQEFLNSTRNLKKLLLIGENKDRLAAALRGDMYLKFQNLDEAVNHANSIATPGDIVLLSPGSPSLDQFRNFSERGEKFQAFVRELK